MSGLVTREFGGRQIGQREDDGFMDGTAMCKAAGKKWSHYWANQETQAYILELAESTGIPADSLVSIRSGRAGGTWVHPKVAIHLAQWCSPKFGVQVTEWVFELFNKGRVEIVPQQTSDPILIQSEMVRSLRTAQLEFEHKLAELTAKADAAITEARAASRTHDSNYGWFTVLAYSNRTQRRFSEAESKVHGQKLGKLARERGIEPQKVGDRKYGHVNAYPEHLLAEYFGDSSGELATV